MQCLGKDMIRSECKKFRKEACRIVTNIAARSEILIKDMVEAHLIEPLCSLLEDDESDVKIEAAWALFNGINGYEYGHIDVYPSKNEKKPHASEGTLAQTKRRKAQQQRCCLSPTSPSGVSLLSFYSMLLCSFDSESSCDIALLNLRNSILPLDFLAGNPREAELCLWLLHPEPSLRPSISVLQVVPSRTIQLHSRQGNKHYM